MCRLLERIDDRRAAPCEAMPQVLAQELAAALLGRDRQDQRAPNRETMCGRQIEGDRIVAQFESRAV